MFQEDFREFIHNRLSGCSENNEQLSAKANELFDQISHVLGEESAHLIGEYEAVITQLEAMAAERAYKVGIKDGLELRRELELVG